MADQVIADLSIADLRTMASASEPKEIPVADPEPEKVEEPAKSPLPSGDAGENKPEKAETVDSEVPEGVKKRIAREVEKQAEYDREIAEHVSRTKAKKAELEKLKESDTGNTGTDPAKASAPAKGKPVKPDFSEYSEAGKSYAEFQADLKKFEGDHEAWLIWETERRAEEKWTAKQREAEAKREWEAAEKEFPGFSKSREVVASGSTEALQLAISELDGWKAVVAHLGKPENAAELKRLSEKAEQMPFAAAAELGRLEDRLKKPESNDNPNVAVLPKPPAKDGGKPSGAAGAVDLNSVGMSRFKQEVRKRLSATG